MSDANHGEDQLLGVTRESQKRFGQLLREVCEVIGFTQGKLSREAKKELQRLLKQGYLLEEDLIGSMEQPTISRVMAGIQQPTYFQVFIWLRVIFTYYTSKEFADICRKLEMPFPRLPANLKQTLWRLSTFTAPYELLQTYEETKDLKLIEIYGSLIEHKEVRWDKTRRHSQNPGTHSTTHSIRTPKVASVERTTYG